MKKAVIATGGKQYIVAEGDEVTVETIKGAEAGKKIKFEVLMLVDGDNAVVGAPYVKDAHVNTVVVDDKARADKVTAIRYKAKKRVHKLHGHRQNQTVLSIDSIVTK